MAARGEALDRVAFALVAAAILLAGLGYVFCGHVQQDEGWYLTAANLVYQGSLPYRDFFYTQAPLHPYLYGLVQRAFGPSLLAGRLTSFALFATMLLVLGGLTARRGSWLAAGLAVALFGSTAMTLWVWTLPLTHASAGLLLLVGGYLVAEPDHSPRARAWGLALLALAMGVRLSLAGALLVAIFVALRRGPTRVARATALAAATLPALIVFLPFVAAAPRNFLFGVWQYHAVRAAQYQEIPIAPTWMAWWTGKLTFTIEAIRGFPLPFLALALGLLAWRRSRQAMGDGERTLLMIAGAVTLVSMLPHPVHATYVAVVMPLVSMVGARLLVAHLAPITVYRPRVLVAAALVATSALVLPHAGVIREWRPGELDGLRTGARRLEATLPPGPLMTFENAMNVEMGRPALPGLEMGPFAFWPYLETERARSLRVVNRELLCEMIANPEIAAVLMRDRERYLLRQSCGDRPLAATMVGRYVLRPELRIERFGQYGALEDGADALNVFTPLDQRAAGPAEAGALAGQSDPYPRPDRPAEQVERQ